MLALVAEEHELRAAQIAYDMGMSTTPTSEVPTGTPEAAAAGSTDKKKKKRKSPKKKSDVSTQSRRRSGPHNPNKKRKSGKSGFTEQT